MGSTSSSPSITPPPANAAGPHWACSAHPGLTAWRPQTGNGASPGECAHHLASLLSSRGCPGMASSCGPGAFLTSPVRDPGRVVPAPGAKARHRVPAGETGRTHAAETRDEGERAVAAACYLEDLIELDRRPRHRGGRSAGRGKADPEQLPARRRPARHDLDAGHSGHPATPLPPGPHPWQAARVLRKRPPQAAVPVRV
jgi:hypothetical protein